MNKKLKDLIDISRLYGAKKDFVIAGGGNTSCKDEEKIWIKASGARMAEITEEDFVLLYRKKLRKLSEKSYPDDPLKREQQVRTDLMKCLVHPGSGKRPSVETSLHEIIGYRYVVHTHPTIVNAVMCSKKAGLTTRELFGNEVLFIPYTDPGFILFKKMEREIRAYRTKNEHDPKVIFLENHGLIVSSDSTGEIIELYDKIILKIKNRVEVLKGITSKPVPVTITEILPAIRMMLSDGKELIARVRNNSLIDSFTGSEKKYREIRLPLTPDMIVYCRPEWIYIEETENPAKILEIFTEKLKKFRERNRFSPKILLLKNFGIIAFGNDSTSADIALDVFEDLLRISRLSRFFGGPEFLSREAIHFIDNWEAENYRRKLIEGPNNQQKVNNKIVIVTGAAQGFGNGIAENMFNEGANVVIADINEEKGKEMEARLNEKKLANRALFVETDVTDERSVRNLMVQTVTEFGGVDILISNAGVLRAGGLDEMDPETFESVTRVNYKGYFICVKEAARVFKLQHRYRQNTFYDIIQINSKSGLKGSYKNFAYAGSKFGGIGLTQSFALELTEYNIKVNSVCPGNFFDGPLWSDPENGLFVQYLRAGKVPGAKSLDDIRNYYEKQVPMGRGCTVSDVMKAIYYLIDQKYETGQAIPVTGGQVMLR